VNDPMRFSSLKKLNEMKYFVFPATKMNLQRLRLGQSLLFFFDRFFEGFDNFIAFVVFL